MSFKGVQLAPGATAEDVLRAAGHGARLFRLQFNCQEPGWARWNRDQYLEWVESQCAWVKSIQPALASGAFNNMLRAVVALFSAPGGYHYTLTGKRVHKIFVDKEARFTFYLAWQLIVRRLAEIRQIIGFDILNEPRVRRPKKWNKVVDTVRHLIRENAEDQFIVVSSIDGNPALLRKLDTFRDPGIWYTFHYYWPFKLTHQGIPTIVDGQCVGTKYPIGEVWTPEIQAKLISQFETIHRWQRNNSAKIYVGEFGCTRWSGYPHNENRLNFIKACLETFDTYGWHHTFHAWRECRCWSVEHAWKPPADPCSVCSDEDPDPGSKALALLKQSWAR